MWHTWSPSQGAQRSTLGWALGVCRAAPPRGDARLGQEGLGKGPLGLWSEAWERVLRGHVCRPDLDDRKDSFSGESVTGRGGCSGPSRW